MNTTNNTALIRLRSHASLKSTRGGNSRHPVYIYLYPEIIKTITILNDAQFQSKGSERNQLENTYYKLQISMTQAPDLIRPKHHTFEPRHKTREELGLFRDLATATEFVIHLDRFKQQNLQKDHIGLLVATFSEGNTGRPRKDIERANLATLYAGKGGEIVTESQVQSLAADFPPSYTGSTPKCHQNSKKRQRTDADAAKEKKTNADDDLNEEYPQTDTNNASKEKRQRTGVDDELWGSRLLSMLEDINCHFRKTETHLSEINMRMSKMETRMSKMETQLFSIQHSGDKLETNFEDTEERFDELKILLRNIDYTLDLTKDRVDDVKRKMDRSTR
ncbi:hypothetical protein V8C35DRAFT_242665 [Trichoderma chlorosporum]